MRFIIYKHTNTITNKSYIGYTSTTMERRFNKHVQDAKRGSNQHFHRAIRKYGTDCWVSEILHECSQLDKAWSLEREMIAAHNTLTEGYNMTEGGEGTKGRTVSDEAKQKSRERHLQFRHTEESKQAMKEKFTKLRGRPVNQYTKDGTYIATYDSCILAAESLGNHNLSGAIHQLCAGTFKRWRQAVVAGFQWAFFEGSTSNINPAPNLREQAIAAMVARTANKTKGVAQKTLDGVLIKTYPSAKNASKETGVCLTSIYSCCKGRLKKAGNYQWEWI